MSFTKGDKVINRLTNEHGVVIDVIKIRGGKIIYQVFYGAKQNKELEKDLIADCDLSDAFERCKMNLYGNYAEFERCNTTFKIGNSNDNTISSLKSSKTLFRPYQFKPLLKFLMSGNRRLLVADEVGLGKTIEAGHIMLELKARNEFKNALIICPKSLQRKWKEELEEKFGLNFTIYNDADEAISDLNDHNGMARGIINYERVRVKGVQKKKKTKKVQGTDETNSNITENKFLDYILNRGKKYSFVLCDEAHKLRNAGTHTYRGMQYLMDAADAVVFLTATPVMLDNTNLYNLLRLLDNNTYYQYQIFENQLHANEPFVRALSALNNDEPLKEIAYNLKNSNVELKYTIGDRVNLTSTTIDELRKDYPIYQRIIRAMENEESTHELRAKLQADLSSMSIMNSIFSRTRKVEVSTDKEHLQCKRNVILRKVKLHEEEKENYDKVIEEYIDDNSYVDLRDELYDDAYLTPGASLGLVQKKRQIASSVYGYLNEEEDLNRGIDCYANYEDGKFEELLSILHEIKEKDPDKKLIVFALFRKTIKYLQTRLKKAGYESLMIHGYIDNRQDVLNEFRDNPNISVLLSSEVGSEGLDMQFCDAMVNYDLPWNPMVVEQRIGRIDRFGQKSEVVNIYNLVVSGSIQEDIYERLLDRIGIFRGTIGDMEAILDARVEKRGRNGMTFQALYSNMEKEFYCTKLTVEERQEKIRKVEQAIENQIVAIHELEEKMTNALTNDAYFKNEITKILKKQSFVTEEELINYVKMAIKNEMTTCDLIEIDDGVYDFVLPKSNTKVLTNFLTTYQPAGEENDIQFQRFKNEIYNTQRIRMTFNQQKAFDNRRLLYINMYNPIIKACVEYFSRTWNEDYKTFSYTVHIDNVVKDRTFFLAVYQLTFSRYVLGKIIKSETLYPLLYDVDNDMIIEDENVVDEMYSISQSRGVERTAFNERVSSEIIDNMSSMFTLAISDILEKKTEDLKEQHENIRLSQLETNTTYYEQRERSLEISIGEHEDRLQLAEDRSDDEGIRKANDSIRNIRNLIKGLQMERQEKEAIINADPQIEINKDIKMLNLITTC